MGKNRNLCAVSFTLVLLTSVTAWAQVQLSVDTQQWWQNLLLQIISFVVAVATPVLSVLLIALLRKWGIKLERDKVESIASKAMSYGEQKAKVALKDGKPMAGPAIMKVALEQADILAKAYSADKKLAVYLENLIESALGEKLSGAKVNGKDNNGQVSKPKV